MNELYAPTLKEVPSEAEKVTKLIQAIGTVDASRTCKARIDAARNAMRHNNLGVNHMRENYYYTWKVAYCRFRYTYT